MRRQRQPIQAPHLRQRHRRRPDRRWSPERLRTPSSLAGSQENAVALANALRTGSPATLTYTSTDANGKPTTTTATITPPTKPMGWGNVSHSLALTQFALNQAGITNPTSAELQAALQGNSITTA